MQVELFEPSREQLPPDLRPDSLAPEPWVHDIRDFALSVSSAPDMQFPHADNVALDARGVSEPLLRPM
ncbi:hypothetical protein GCM10010412_076260 [Nonomuraea recticatena]|uniref:Uncharacterized protein n=1 Tax=Nonomuraea recticatena TaxID=46178 RepID=A0ABP6FA85_9ACTN